MAKLTLGLDIGPNSIGWALVDKKAETLVAAGVRIFTEGVDQFDTTKEKSRNEDRRLTRGMRRQTARRAQRKKRLGESLVSIGMFPCESAARESLLQQDPYALRVKALDEKLTPHELGRVLLHLNQRRGFLSNRKRDREDNEVKGMLAEISNLGKAIEESGARTLGEYLHRKGQSFDHRQRIENDHVRNRHTRRDMLQEEFDLIWRTQAKHHPKLLTDALRRGVAGALKSPRKPLKKSDQLKGKSTLEAFGLEGLIFFQRTMYWPASVVGLCEYEPKQKRCPRADRQAERFRLLQEVNNLKFFDPDLKYERPLSHDQRTLLLEHLATRDKATFDQLRKQLGFLDTVKFNLERGKRSFLKGMTVDWQMANALGKGWHKRPDDEKNRIVRLLLNNEREDDQIAQQLVNEFGCTAQQADKALCIDFPDKYVHVSLMAINKLLPYLEQGMLLMANDESDSALHAAGYLRGDERPRRLFDELPDPQRMRPGDCPLGDIPNPVVKRTLVELRKVVNAIIREYGKPEDIHVEMARSIKMGLQARTENNKRMREREKIRSDAADNIREFQSQFPGQGVRVNRGSILRYLLWEQQNHECLYCQQTITQQQLFGGETDVDHILPYSKTLDDSQNNKVVCHRRCNHDKGNRTPYEWLAASDPPRFEKICRHAASLLHQGLLPYFKLVKLQQKELDANKFIARQLVDTAYISRVTAEYLTCLYDRKDKHKVLGLKGQHTATLRWQWGLSRILNPDDRNLKTRDDHRHHAVDAIVVALTDRKQLQKLAKGIHEVEQVNEAGEIEYRQQYTGKRIEEPWEHFRRDVEERLHVINVSHRAERKVAGALHEESLYGPTQTPGEFVKRKPLAELSANEIGKIRDDAIRELVIAKLKEAGLEFGRGKTPDKNRMKEVLANLTMKSGVPVKKVRLLVSEKTIQPIREGRPGEAYVKPGATHHLCIFEWEAKGKTKRGAVFVTQLAAINRVKRQTRLLNDQIKTWKQEGAGVREIEKRRRSAMREIAAAHPVIDRRPPPNHPNVPADARFVMSLSRGEMVLVESDSEQQLLKYATAASTSQQMWFVEHTDARKKKDQKTHSFSPNTLDARKVTVDLLGRIRWAND